MLSSENFEVWCAKNRVSEKAKAFISRVRGSQPSRAVGNRLRNVKGAYPSNKNGFMVQFESHTAELCGIYTYEYDADVLEYYDQPELIYVRYKDKNGRAGLFGYRPDFLVITESCAFIDEWKTENQIAKLSADYPDRYYRDSDGTWHYVPGEEFADSIGLQFRVRTTEEINYTLHRNIQFLEDYLRADNLTIPEEKINLILSTVKSSPGTTLSSLIDSLSPQVSVDFIYIMISDFRIYLDLETYLLVDPEHAIIFPDEEIAKALKIFDTQHPTLSFQDLRPVLVDVGGSLVWDGIPLTIEFVGASSIVLKGRDDKIITLEKSLLNKFVREGIITGLTTVTGTSRDFVLEIIMKASKDALIKANHRYQTILPYLTRNNHSEKWSGLSVQAEAYYK
ncbi:MAG: TnsA endonuclease C-terminal domain-containing protein [Nitrospirae bacterium]|nr:TnsA endonuclease C-terminal domain-containing protein [Nitrospirota bacterium]